MKKTIWLINQYASTPETGMGGRHYYLARELAKQGFNVYLIAASYTHLLREPPKNIMKPIQIQSISDFKFVWIKVSSYPDAHSKKRVINWFDFAWKLRKLKKSNLDDPNVILYSSPSLIGYLGAQWLAKQYKVPLTFEVRDIWPLTLTEIGGYSPRHPFVRFLQWIEDKAYRESDHVVSNLRNAVEHMVARGMDKNKFSWIPNGFLMDEVTQAQPISPTTETQLPKDKFIIGYTGTLGVANGLDTLIYAAEYLREHHEIIFVVVGGGKEKVSLESLVKEKSIENVFFVDPIPKIQVQSMLKRFDACFIGWLDDDLYRFGIGANKIPEYLYSGTPIVHSYSGACDPVAEYNAGITLPAGNSQALAEGILRLYAETSEEREKMGRCGHLAAVKDYEYGQLASNLSEIMFDTN